MTELEKNLTKVYETLTLAEKYEHAVHVLNFDLETICPEKAMENQGETIAFFSTEGFKLIKDPAFIEASEYIYEHRYGSGTKEAPGEDALSPMDIALAEMLHARYAKVKNITPALQNEFSRTENKAYIDWVAAKNADDFSLFAPSLTKIREIGLKKVELLDDKKATAYDALLDDYERGMTEADLDEAFGTCKETMLPLLEKIKKSRKVIRTDFLSRPVTDEQQRKMARYLLETIGYDFSRGAFTTTEHPFTDWLAKDDVRVTTHYYPNMFTSNLYSIVHEGGHALFGLLQPAECYDHKIANNMTYGMHESVSRFYENRVGRSEAFTDLIFEQTSEIFPGVLSDVTKREFYEGVNLVTPSFIRTEADEFTYTFHIIIRYEIEKMILRGEAKIEDLPKIWNDKYEEYLGIRPKSFKEGVLQDVHWSSGFGYFPTYALGNMYNAMYCETMDQEIDRDALIRNGEIEKINQWMAAHVFAKANMEYPKDWIQEITGQEFTTKPFLYYLENKFGAIYGL